MANRIFVVEEPSYLPLRAANRLSQRFEPKSVDLPLYPRYTMIEQARSQPSNNYLPIIAVVGMLSFFAFLGFLAYMRASK